MSATPPSITQEAGFIALRAFLRSIMPPDVEVIRGKINRVAMPVGDNFVVMSGGRRMRLATNEEGYAVEDPNPVALANVQRTQWEYQIDIYGPASPDHAQTIATLWRSNFACEALAAAFVQPLFAGDPLEMPFETGEKQIEIRYTLNLALQCNPVVSTPQQFAATLSADIVPIPGA